MRLAANLALDQRINERLARGEDILHLGFGESRLPVPPALFERLADPPTDYGPVAGREGCLEALAGYFSRRSLPTTSSSVLVAPGSKPLFLALMAVRPGLVVVATPAWVTYEPQARLLDRHVLRVPVPVGQGGIPDPDRLERVLSTAVRAGESIALIVVTNPDNPTGAGAEPATVRAVVEIAERYGALVVSDEIYRDVIFDESRIYLSPAEAGNDVVVVTGLSKSLSIGGWRVGAARFSDDAVGRELRADVLGIASHIWSNTSAPMQNVAEYAFSEPPSLVAHRQRCTRLHGLVAREVHRLFTEGGLATATPPVGGFYVYPDFGPIAEGLKLRGVRSSEELEQYLLDVHGVAVLGGHHFGDDPSQLRFRAATSLLYGRTTEERMEAMLSDTPLELPGVRRSLDRLERLMNDLALLS